MQRGDSGPLVANLQELLALVLERGVLQPPNMPGGDELARWVGEREKAVYGEVTRRFVQLVQIQYWHDVDDRIIGVVEERTAELLNAILKELVPAEPVTNGFVVRGRVTLAGGAPASKVIVRARDRDLRTFQALGEDAVTNADGRYEIRYSGEDFARAEAGGADLVIRVFGTDDAVDPDRPLVESETMFDAPAVAEIDLEIADGSERPVEFHRHLTAIEPLLAGQADGGANVGFAELTDADIDFLAGDSGIDRQHVAWLRTAFAFAGRTRVERLRSILAELFYGWFREGQPDEWEQLAAQSTSALRGAAQAAIRHEVISAGIEDYLATAFGLLPNPLRDTLSAAVASSGAGDEVIATILGRVGSIGEVSNPLLSELVVDGRLTAADAHLVGLALAAHDVVDGDQSASATLLRADRGINLKRARDLASLGTPFVETVFRADDVVPPDGMTLSEYATEVAARIADRFPTDATLHRAAAMPEEVYSALKRVLVTDAVAPGSRIDGDPALRPFINLHPGLGLAEVIEGEPDGELAFNTVQERVSWIDRVRALNPDLDLFRVDYLPDSQSFAQVQFGELGDDARSMVAAEFKAFQRLQTIGASADDSVALLSAGYGSATALALSLPSEVAEQTGLPLSFVYDLHAVAEQKATDASLTWFAFHDLERDVRVLNHGTLPRPPAAYLKRLKGYGASFAGPTFCHCENCQSVLGPAAYFVDLMYFVERNILDPSFKDYGSTAHDLHLYSRRRDLWGLELTCENTTGVVPTLDLVNALLETFIIAAGAATSPEKLYERLAAVDHSVRLPVSLPLEKLSLWLRHLDLERVEIADTLLLSAASSPRRARVRLGLSPEQSQLITKSRLAILTDASILAAQSHFEQMFKIGLGFSTLPGETETRALAPGNPLDIRMFSRAIGVDAETAGAILTTEAVDGGAPGAPTRIWIDSGIGSAGGVQVDSQVVKSLTSGRLDRFERFVRLWRHVPWTVRELDYVLGRLAGTGNPSVASQKLNEAVVTAVAQLRAVQDRLHVPVDELCALTGELPTDALRGESSLFGRVFDPIPDANALITAFRPQLAAALHVGDDDFTLLTDALMPCLGRLNPDPLALKTFTPGLWANLRNLSLLFRHARLAQLLKLSVEELLQTVVSTPEISGKPASHERCVLTLADLTAVLDLHRWRVASGFTMRGDPADHRSGRLGRPGP